MSTVVLPPVLLAVTVYVPDGVISVGVPVISPVEESRVKPVGSDGETDQAVTVPPLFVGGVKDTGVSLVKVNGSPL